MGIESDQVVYEYLSRVGDLAQQQQLPSATRMRLVSALRDEIDRARAKAPVDSPVAVRRIISRLGSPDEVVAAAGGSGDVPEPRTAVPVQRVTAADVDDEATGWAGGLTKGLRRRGVPRPRRTEPAVAPDDGPSPPHLAPEHELGNGVARPDWWQVGGGGSGGGGFGGGEFGLGDAVPGFVGGVEIPELLKPPPVRDTEAGGKGRSVEKTVPGAAAPSGPSAPSEPSAPEADETGARRRRLPRLRPLGGGWSNPLLLLAAGLLVAGAVVGSLVPLAAGWLIAYLSRRLSQNESKWAVVIIPGLAAAGGVVWLWGRADGRWGDPIVQGQMNAAVAETWPWVVRVAAVGSALYLLWRSQRAR
ncbi:hypothetical protein SGFS_055270 [Streptomyces graminofaciens]|uniref:Integral membrane protein n=1 Tax=Streptomyces graminofaciens TaxID=68212 RepID=A0ABN5VM78_9ACTN|nr:hypothetical protein [Streptomyces graminofaciens]BBC34233.1 hypothetical protein SGFS_055270 [Streptomyces graminofaciens]